MNPTPQDRFRVALMGSLLGPIYFLQYGQRSRHSSTPNLWRANPRQLTPAAETLLKNPWELLSTAGETALKAWASETREAAWAGITDSVLGGGLPEEQLLQLLPWLLLRLSWLSPQQSLGQCLLANNSFPIEQSTFAALRVAVEPYGQQAACHGELAWIRWLHSADCALPGETGLKDSDQGQRRLGSQLLTLNWGASQGGQSLPWAAKAWLGVCHLPLLKLSDRLYAAWSGQADFQKLGVSCEGGLTVATPII